MAALFKKQQNKTSEKNWYKDRFQSIAIQRNILAMITLLCLGATLLSIFSVSQLTPLKSVQPFVIQIDDKTGRTQIVEPVEKLTAEEAVVRYFIHQYITAREEYSSSTYQHNFEIVRLMSETMIFSRYQALMAAENPNSPLTRLGTESQRVMTLRSLVQISDDTAQARITVKTVSKHSTTTTSKDYIVWLTYAFEELKLTTRERYINPLGFRVTSYRVEEEFSE